MSGQGRTASAAGARRAGRSRFRIDARNCANRPPGRRYLRNVNNVPEITGSPDPDSIQTAADFARALQALRDVSGLRIREVARLTGGQRSTVGGYFSGQHLPLDRELLTRLLMVCGEDDQARIERWQQALIRVRRRPRRRSEAPYRGLARYEEADAQWFFGRDDVTDLLVSLGSAPSELPLMLIGPSGAGKSSVLRAGLLPRLDDVGWPADVVDLSVTGVRELTKLAVELTAQGAQPEAPAAGDARRRAVIIDQFEAAFTLCDDEGERNGLVSALSELARTALVVLALRADFYGQAIRYPGLRQALQERHVVLGPMTPGQVRDAVVRPAQLARAEVDEGLLALLLADLGPADQGRQAAYEAGALPLLSHAMLATWEHSRGGTLSVADYQASGGIRNALTQTAEQAYESLTDGQRRLARQLFLRLVHVADGVPPSRASVALGELPGREEAGDGEAVLATFVGERMITVDEDAAQITHDALLTAWPRLRAWIEESTDELRDRGRITEGARAWAEAGREEDALWRGSRLALAREWAGDPVKRAALSGQALSFVDASVTAGAASERAARRRTRWLQGTVAVLAALVLAVAGVSGYAFSQRSAARGAESAALRAAGQANSRDVAFTADQLRSQDPAVAAQLSVSADEFARTPQATASLLESSGAPSVARIDDSPGIVQWVAVSPDRRLLAAAGADGTLRLWNVAAPGRPALAGVLLTANGGDPLYAAAFSPDGKLLAAAGAGRTVTLWEISGTKAVRLARPLSGPASTVYSVAFSPDAATLAAASADGTVRLWHVADPARAVQDGAPLVTGKAGTYPNSVAFSPDGRTVAAGTSAGTVWLWALPGTAALAAGHAPAALPGMPLTGPANAVSGVSFSPDGGELAASSKDQKVWLWRVKAGRAVPDGTLTGAVNWVNTVAFSPDGRSLAGGTSGARVLVWSMATRRVTAELPHPQPVTSVTWDGPRGLAAAGADGTVMLWALPSAVLAIGSAPTQLAYGPGGGTLAVGGDGSVQLWGTSSRALLASFSLPATTYANAVTFRPAKAGGPLLAVAVSNGTVELLSGSTLAPVAPPLTLVTGTEAVESVAFSPDGRLLAAGADDGSVRLFDVTSPAHPRQLTVVRGAGTADPIYTVVFAPDGKTIAAASVNTDSVQLWRLTGSDGLLRAGPDLGGMASYPIGLAFTPDGRTLAIGNSDKSVYLWDVAAPARPRPLGAPLTGPSGQTWTVAISPDGKTLAAGANDGTVWLWNLADPAHPALTATLTGLPGHVFSVAFSPDGAQLAAASYDDDTVRLWDTSPAAARTAICGNLGQPVSPREWASYVPGVPYRAPCSLGLGGLGVAGVTPRRRTAPTRTAG
jgi:WD40 repeat protein